MRQRFFFCHRSPSGIVNRPHGFDDDARITLTVETETVRGDTRNYCQLNIRVTENDVNFSRGDKIFLWVKEDDILGDDTVWERVITVQGRGTSIKHLIAASA